MRGGMKKLLVSALAALALSGCAGSSTGPSNYEPTDPGGPGLTYNGKLGYDTGTGFVVPYDGSGPTLGYGF